MVIHPLCIPLLVAAVATSAAEVDPAVQRGIETVTEQRILADVEILCGPELDGRLSGTDGYLRAAVWSADRFADLGLEPAGGDGFYQWFDIECNEIVAEPRLAIESARTGAAPWEATPGRDFTCRGFTGSGDVTAPVTFVGYGLSLPDRGHDDYADVDVHGRVVLCFKRNPGWKPADGDGWDRRTSVPRAKARMAAAHGAAALLWVDLPPDDTRFARGPIGSVMHGSGEHLADFPHLEISEEVADRLLGGKGEARRRRAAIDSLRQPISGPVERVVSLQVDAHHDPARSTCNVVAALPGADPVLRNQVLILGAHLDHVGRQSPDFYFPGANDNASGSAAVLALAEAFVRSGRPPARTVVFVLFAGEESGLEGSRYHAAHPLFPLAQTVAMFNFDCVAHGDSIKVGCGKSHPELWNEARGFDAAGARLMTAATWEGGGADATPFFDGGVPTLYWVTTKSYTHLHVPSDTPETLDAALYTELVRLAFRTAWHVAQGG